jgi:hypothetical protein
MTDPETGEEEVRYVGKGGGWDGRRVEEHLPKLLKGKHDNQYLREWSRIPSVAFRSVIVHDGMTEDEAFYGPNGECHYIELYGRYDTRHIRGFGLLANMTDGGDGVYGLICTAETRAKLSAANTGAKHPPRSPEYRAKISAAMKGRPPPIKISKKGIPLTNEHRAKISAACKGVPKSAEHSKKVADTKRGKPSNRTGHKLSPESIAKRTATAALNRAAKLLQATG